MCHDDASPETREGVSHRVEILYTDSMNARLVVDGREESVGDIGVERMLSVVDTAGARTTSSSPGGGRPGSPPTVTPRRRAP